MKKIFLIFTFLLAASNLFGAYKIKIAVYKDRANLMTYLSKVPGESYRKNILIEEKNHLYYVSSTLYENKKEINKALSAYQKVFPDAFITEVEQEVIASAPSEVVAPTPELKMPEPIKNEQVNTLNAKMLLENKTVYICNENGSKSATKQIVKLNFKKDYVLYSKLKKGVPPIQIPYTFDQDSLVLPMSGINFKYKIYQEDKDYLSAKSFIEDKEGNHFRYYFDEDLALDFVRHQ